MTTIIEKTETIMEQLRAGEFVKGMEDYYADDVVNEEPTGDQVRGKAAVIKNEHETLAKVAEFHGATVHAVGGQETSPGNGVTFAEYELKVDLKDGTTFSPKQVQVMRWENGLAKHVRFYYDPAQI